MEGVLNGFGNVIANLVATNAQLAGTIVLLMAGCMALSAHWGKIIVYAGAAVYGLAVVLSLYMVSVDLKSGPMKLSDFVVIAVCILSAFWAFRNYAHHHDHTSNGMLNMMN